ncbi:hypothetical protein [Kiloniella sp.]|uniref:hypothetical protein n=1 Tax=Kiloniella sp. TaxID=1938587 RepID=UPI003B02E9E3
MNLLKIAVFGSLLLSVAACQTTRPVPPGMYHSQQKYLTFGEKKAMVGAMDTNGAYTFGWAWNQSSADEAINSAMSGCLENKDSYEVLGECKVHFIGNTNVRNFSEEELQLAITAYDNGEPIQKAEK